MDTNVINKNQIVRSGYQMPVPEIQSMAEAFYKSGMFKDTTSAAAALVKIQAGQEVGIKPFAAMTGIYIIQGKPTIGAGIIASRIKASGKYNYQVVKMEDAIVSIDFYEGKEMIGNSTFTKEDALRAGTQNLGKFPKNMLFARAISNGVKWFAPDVFDGPVYVPEEMEEVTEDTAHEELPGTNTPANLKPEINIADEDPKPFEIPGHWYAKLEKCKTKADVLAIYTDHKETIDAEPELQKLLKETSANLSKLKTA